mmetsp:Transcript_6510/g.11041  ORF Transcript_6510/g.11041 Transcript_6510/m.11041 type:complete len:91 (+) Transcript_6510:303-575(+)
MVRGLFRGVHSPTHFNLLFDWFYPAHFQTLSLCLQPTFQQSTSRPQIVLKLLKLTCELLDNSYNRLIFNSWSINGLVLFKEAAQLAQQML